MSKQAIVNLNNPSEVRKAGLSVLKNELGPAGMTVFLQQFESGSGDFTAEKYQSDDVPLAELVRKLKSKSL
ncbi:MAG: hypothetical protein LBJ91_03740 [Clostridiales Family XIII bacterium]|jgi:hypothetical protein|nr:hypothetical protein [Clostridiales Family XIII bacterium]